MLIDTKTGNPIYNANELQAQENEKGIQKAIPLTPEENTQEQAKERHKEYEEKAKQKKWTQEDLIKLAFEYKIESLGGETLLSKEDHEKQGDPAELQKDIKILRQVLLDEKKNIILEGVEKAKIIDGTNFLYGLVLDWHIMSQGFVVQVIKNEPKILPAEQNPTPERQQRAQKIQEALTGEGGQDFGYYTDIKKGTKTPVLSNYIATETFHRVNQKGKSLETYRSELEKMIGGDGVSPLDEKKILDSSLNGQQKSFLLSWRKRTDDSALKSITEHETKNVINARTEWNQKSELEKKAYLRENGIKSSLIYVGGLALMAGLLVAGIKTLKDGSWWKKILFGIPAVLIGGSFLMNKLQKGFNEFGGQNILEPFTTARPTDKKDVERTTVNIDMDIIAPVKVNLSRLQARLAGGEEGIEILMNKDVGQNIATTYPVYSMLNSLNSDERNLGGKYEAPDEKNGTPVKDITTGLDKLQKEPNQQAQLNTVIKDTWERYKKTTQFTTGGLDKAKTTNLADMLAAIEIEDGWLNRAIDSVSTEPEKQKALKVIGQNPAAWGDINLGDLKGYFLSNTIKPNATIEKNLQDYRDTHKGGLDPKAVLIQYLQILNLSSGTMTFREYLSTK